MTAEGSERIELWKTELREIWDSFPNRMMFLIGLAVWAALFQFYGSSTFGYLKSNSLFSWMYYVFTTSEDDGHCLFIPLVVLALFWWKRKELVAVAKQSWWGGLVLVAIGLALHLGGYVVQQNRISIVGFLVGLYGLMGLAWGPRWLGACAFPFFLLAFCVPLGTMADTLTFPLRLLVSTISSGIGRDILGIEVVRQGTMLFDPHRPDFQFDVAAACSGLRSLTVLLALTTIYGFVSFRSWWKRGVMVLSALPLAVIGNVVRITGVIVTAEAFGQKAGTRFHDGAGFVVFVLAMIGVMALGSYLREETGPPRVKGSPV